VSLLQPSASPPSATWSSLPVLRHCKQPPCCPLPPRFRRQQLRALIWCILGWTLARRAWYVFYTAFCVLRSGTRFTQLYLVYAAVHILRSFSHFTQMYVLYADVRAFRRSLRSSTGFTQFTQLISPYTALRHRLFEFFMLAQLYTSKHLCVKLHKASITLCRLYAVFTLTLCRLYVSPENLYAALQVITLCSQTAPNTCA
jgi:hypothetical protein